MIKLSDYVFRFIADQGVRHVFMLPGGGAMHLVDSLGKCPDIEYVCNLHEQAAAIAAEAYGRYTNNLGVALVTSGPGGTNAITGVAGAWLASTPCLIISGQVKRADMKGDLGVRQLGQQELDIVSIVKTITKYAVVVTDPYTIRYHLEKAVFLAGTGRKGPVWIDIPLDVQAAQIDPGTLQNFDAATEGLLVQNNAELPGKVSQVIKVLNGADRPVLLLGHGIHHSGAHKDIAELADLLNIPVLTTWAGANLLPDSHPLMFGKPGILSSRGANFTVQNSDCLITIGVRLDFDVTGFNQVNFARAAKKVIVDIDIAEINKLKNKITVDVPVHADAGDFIREMLNQKNALKIKDRSFWLDRCNDWKQKYPILLPEYWGNRNFINIYVFTTLLCESLLEDDLIIPGSSGTAIDAFWQAFKSKPGQRAFSTGGLGAMGFGIPASIGGCLASGKKRTVSVDGDGGFFMNVQELALVAQRELPIKYFVLNNRGYASIRSMQRNHFKGNLVASDAASGLFLPDTLRVAESYGIPAIRISEETNLRERIVDVLNTSGPIICDVMIDPDQLIGPRASSAVLPDGSMVSKPLEDLAPFLDREEFYANMIIPPLNESKCTK
jgi:acetolactate synthase-1/2/3 large subunit